MFVGFDAEFSVYGVHTEYSTHLSILLDMAHPIEWRTFYPTSQIPPPTPRYVVCADRNSHRKKWTL